MDHFASLGADIGALVPELGNALASQYSEEPVSAELAAAIDGVHAAGEEQVNEVVDEQLVEEDSEEVADESTEQDSTQESEDVDNEVQDDEKPDALGEALARLSAQETLNKSLQSDLDSARVKLEAPVFVPYEDLPEDVQREFDIAAERAGVDPRVILYHHYQRVVADHESKANSMANQRSLATQSAFREVDKFFDDHPLKSKHGQALMTSLKSNAAWTKLGPLAQTNPDAFQVAAVALLDAGFRKAEADDALRQRNVKTQKQLKASTRSEASRATAAPSVAHTKPNQGEINAASMAEFMKTTSSPLGSFFR